MLLAARCRQAAAPLRQRLTPAALRLLCRPAGERGMAAAVDGSGGCGDSAGGAQLLAAAEDRYDGVIIDESRLPADPAAFGAALAASLSAWAAAGKRGVWLKLPRRSHAALVPFAVDGGFEFHHAEADYVMMTKWLPPDSPNTLPPNASHQARRRRGGGAAPARRAAWRRGGAAGQRGGAGVRASARAPAPQVGVGAFVVNARREVLVVQEANGPLRGEGFWKMPTGLVHAGEDLIDAVEREVAEETGVAADFAALIAVRQAHGFLHGKSDLFFCCGLTLRDGGGAGEPPSALKPCEREIAAVRWMPLEEYAQQPYFSKLPEAYHTLLARCVAWADGRYRGLRGRVFDGSPGRPRRDLLMWGDVDDAAVGGGESGASAERAQGAPRGARGAGGRRLGGRCRRRGRAR
ncbi:NUDT2 [Scenedesmus sp. PABB004]|nr:NUDT2 [Scenedesmus sp. PABB004]